MESVTSEFHVNEMPIDGRFERVAVEQIDTLEYDTISRLMMALAHPHRRAILDRLAAGARTSTRIVETMPISRQCVIKHLAVLRAAGLVAWDGQVVSRREHPLVLVPGQLDDLATWLHALATTWRSAEHAD